MIVITGSFTDYSGDYPDTLTTVLLLMPETDQSAGVCLEIFESGGPEWGTY